jgi:hypothetical protein
MMLSTQKPQPSDGDARAQAGYKRDSRVVDSAASLTVLFAMRFNICIAN